MRNLFFLLYIFIFTATSVNAEYVVIPDENFRNFLIEKYPGCFNEEGEMDASCIEITRADTISLGSFEYNSQIMSLDGIKYFTGLKYLDCSYTSINQLPELPTSLTALICSYCYELTSLSLPPNLRYLNCSFCQFSSVPPMPDSIKFLDFSYNNLDDVSLLPQYLEEFDCSVNQITTLPELPATLVKLNCSFNNINHLPELINSNLIMLVCGNNPLGSLPALPKSLQTLYCNSNHLNELPALPDGCIELNCSSNIDLGNFISGMAFSDTLLFFSCQECGISSLPPLPPRLRFLDCGFNQLSNLPPLPATLVELICLYNQLNALPDLPVSMVRVTCYHNDIYCLPKMPGYDDSTGTYRFELDFDGDKIKCIPSLPPNAVLCDFSEGSGVEVELPVCNPTNNVNRCTPFPLVTGTVFFDNDSDGLHDINEPVSKNIKVVLSNGATAFTDENGNFAIETDTTGSYTVSIISPSFFATAPVSYSYDFTSYDTSVSARFALQPVSSNNNFTVNINSVSPSASPVFPLVYSVNYENTGSIITSPEIVLHFDSTRLVYDSSSVAMVSNNGDSLRIAVEGISPGQHGNFKVYFTVKPAAMTGDSVHISVSATANENNYRDSNCVVITSSFAANVKQATEQLSVSQAAAGKFVDYNIYFQNTGTGSVLNVVISDTVSSLLDLSTLELVNSSHLSKTTVNGNIIYFEFPDIFLPDSTVDKLKSRGFVTFRLRPVAPVAVNSIIENKASIYFDYGTPVTTNTALTVIKEPGRIFVFTGDGDWDNFTNWKDGMVPPGSLNQNEMVIIDPVAGGYCILDVPLNVLPGASVIVQRDKQFVIPNNLIIQ